MKLRDGRLNISCAARSPRCGKTTGLGRHSMCGAISRVQKLHIDSSQAIYAGVAVRFHLLAGATLAVAVRDSSYPLDFAEFEFPSGSRRDGWPGFTEFILEKARDYQEKHSLKFVGLAMSTELCDRCPELCSRLWAELDIIPIVLHNSEEKVSWGLYEENLSYKSLDEHAESMARKCIRLEFRLSAKFSLFLTSR